MKIVGLLGAKANSKRLPNKALLDFHGKPMFQWNVEKGVKIFKKMYVTSDSKEILKKSEELGAIPIMRYDPKLMKCPNITYYKHALQYMDNPDVIVAIQINSPTVDVKLIKRVKELMERGYDEVKTCHEDYTDYGSVWAINVKKLKVYSNPYKANPNVWIIDRSVDIHNKNDYRRARSQFQRKHQIGKGNDRGSKSL